MRPTDLLFNQTLGIIDALPDAEHLLELPLTTQVRHYPVSMQAGAQFAFVEAASAERLRRASQAERVGIRGVPVNYPCQSLQ